jgi:serine/threonine protein kinase
VTDLFERLNSALADRYSIERELGAGGMATFYLAEDLKHERQVPVKVLRPELAAALGLEHLLCEIRVTAKLNHPHILELYNSGEAEAFLYNERAVDARPIGPQSTIAYPPYGVPATAPAALVSTERHFAT